MIGVKGTVVRLSDVDLTVNPFGQISTRAMVRQVQHQGLFVRLRADIDIVGGTSIGTVRNRGLISALIRRENINENGDRSTQVDPRVAKVFAAAMAPQTQTQVAALADDVPQANTILEDFVPLHLALPLLASPHETNFLERDPDQDLDLEFETQPVPLTALVSGSDAAMVVNSFTAEIGQKIDRVTGSLPFFIPLYRQVAQRVITGAVTDEEIPLKVNGFVGMLIVQQLGGAAYETADVITRMELKGSAVKHFEGRFTDDFMRQFHETQFGGDIPAGYTVYNFLENGRLSGIHNPIQDPDLKLVVDADVSALGGTTQVNVWALELNQDPAITAPLPEAFLA